MNASDRQYAQMIETPIPKLITTMAFPTVISMLVTNIYNMADTFFVSRLGTSASGAVGITATLSLLILTVGLTFGHGAGSIISRALGKRDDALANHLTSTSFFAALIVGVIGSILGLAFLNPLLRLLGSTETVLPYARSYGIFILIAAPFTIAGFVLNNIMRYEGKAHLAMVGLSAGAILNILLDPIFIFGFQLGTAGAGISTALSQIISFSLLLYMYLSGKTQCKISWRMADARLMLSILKNGLPTTARQGMNCISAMLLNRAAAVYGDAALSAISIVNQISHFIVAIMIGIGQGYQPVAGYNFGAGRYDRLRQGFYFTFLLGEVVLSLLSVVFFFAATHIVTAFRDDPQVVAIGITMLRLQCISLICQPYCTCANMMFQSIGETGRATLLATTRNGLYLIPAVLILPRVLGLLGIQLSQPVADVAALLTAIPLTTAFFIRIKKEYENKKDAQEI